MAHKDSKLQRARLFKIASALVVMLVVLIGALTAMMFVAVEASKENETGSNGVMMVKGSDTVVQVATYFQLSPACICMCVCLSLLVRPPLKTEVLIRN